MNCTFDGNNARIFAKAVQSLAKFGAELFIEGIADALVLRSLNSSQSAVGTIKFNKIFFETYKIVDTSNNFCKLSMKACVNVFRSMKQVEHCEMRMLLDKSKFQIIFKCRLETTKNILLSILDEENMCADVPASNSPNIIVGTHKLLTDITNNFTIAEEELTLEVNEKYLMAKNYVEGARVSHKFMRSKLKISSNEFESYQLEKESVVTFCLKEFRAILLFAEALNEVVTLNFEQSGSPIFFEIKKYDQIECLLIMSTLSSEDVSFHDDCNPAEVTMSEYRKKSNVNDADVSQREIKRRKIQSKNANLLKSVADALTFSNDSTLFQFDNISSNQMTENTPATPSLNAPRNVPNNDDIMTYAEQPLPIDAAATADATQLSTSHGAPPNTDIVFYDTEDGLPSSTGAEIAVAKPKNIPKPNNNDILMTNAEEQQLRTNFAVEPPNTNITVTFYDTEDGIPTTTGVAKNGKGELIPESPQQKQKLIRSIFSRCFEATYVPKEPSPNSEFFVPDSDAED